MTEYIDLVLCKHPDSESKYLFQAPAFSPLNKGDMVLVDTSKGKALAEVVQKTFVEKGSDLHDFIIEITKAKLPLRKVQGKYTFTGFEYEDDAGIIEQG